MAKKDFDKYFDSLYSQYHELLETLREAEVACADKMMTPEQLEQVKQTVDPVKQSFLMVSYVKYLLDMPSRDTKKNRYKKEHSKQLSHCLTEAEVKKLNAQSISTVKEILS